MKPILFNTEMARAILENRKTVTRRVIKPRSPKACGFCVARNKQDGLVSGVYDCYEDGRMFDTPQAQPAYVGDILYVRECFARIFGRYIYRADYERIAEGTKMIWHPSIHMPCEAARIFLRVTDVRVERLQDITELDILEKEGVKVDFPQPKPSYISLAYTETRLKPAVRKAFSDLWDSTIKLKDRALYGWEASPWVWVIGFKRISKEEAVNG